MKAGIIIIITTTTTTTIIIITSKIVLSYSAFKHYNTTYNYQMKERERESK